MYKKFLLALAMTLGSTASAHAAMEGYQCQANTNGVYTCYGPPGPRGTVPQLLQPRLARGGHGGRAFRNAGTTDHRHFHHHRAQFGGAGRPR